MSGGLTSALHDAKTAERTRWGRLDAFFDYSRYNDDWIVRPMSRQMFDDAGGFAGLPWDRNQRHYGLNFEIPLYMGGELSAGIRIRRLEADRAEALLEGTRRQLRFNAVSLYSGIQTLDVMTGALDELIAALQTTKERLDLMVKTGKRPEIDRLKVVEELEDARARHASIRVDRVKLSALLLALMGREPSGDIVADPLPERLPKLTLQPDELRAAARENSVVRRARLTADQGEEGVRKSTASCIPRVIAGGNYTRHDAPSVDGSLNTWEVSVGVIVPLFHGTSRFEDLAAAKERRSAAEENVVRTRMESAAELEEALARFDSAQAEVRAAKARVAAGDEAARIEAIRYETGAGTVEDLLRAQSKRENARASLAGAVGAVVTAAERINTIVEREAVQ